MKKSSGVHASPRKKCAMKIKKRCVYKNVFNGRKWFISHMRNTSEKDHNELQVNDSRYNKDTVLFLLSKRVNGC